ncbi:srpk, putative [Talaromyces stipitatus ATCC 10500]|uniref:non-specific serine/threonine protein kinase n=1 Tax=Talaromyces stipitatus (strain ATCC 10500 / CBS 375.48 / QM 6759 / NRRL 1006) TaxID=441959 RepID=B8MTV6_TALSN|nr:srpk, putative [Talaromyces stipitatus ATCC 10500]EED12499.1 srpk, putative [Talaromyces stipitatus ATCC 10500]
MDHISYFSNVDAELLHRYRPGGYQPIALGDTLKGGRYKVLHKLGWEDYSTAWATRDQREENYVAVKVSISESESYRENREASIMKKLETIHPCPQHAPWEACKIIAKQALTGLDHLHQLKICHGDLHTRNLVFPVPCMKDLLEDEVIQILNKPETSFVESKDGEPIDGAGVPKYIVRPAAYHFSLTRSVLLDLSIKIIDFGESFCETTIPRTVHTSLVFKHLRSFSEIAQIIVLLFELFVAHPPFDNLMRPAILVDQMREMASDTIPERWREVYTTTISSANTSRSWDELLANYHALSWAVERQ